MGQMKMIGVLLTALIAACFAYFYIRKMRKNTKVAYANKLVNLSYDQDLYGREETAKKLYTLAAEQNMPEIWTQYAEGLVCLSFKQDLSGLQNTADKLHKLAIQQNTREIWRAYAEGLANLSSEQSLSGVQKTVKKLCTLATEQNNPEIWVEYADGLVSLSYKQDLTGIKKTADKLYTLSIEQNNSEIWTKYAEALVILSYEQDLTSIEKTVDKLYTLAVEQNNPDIWVEYADGLLNLSKEQELTDREKTIEKLYKLAVEQNNPKIWERYDKGDISKLSGGSCGKVIYVNQIHSVRKKEYEISGINAVYTAEVPFMNDCGYIELNGSNNISWLMRYKSPPLNHLLPFGLGFWGTGFGRKVHTNEYKILQDDQVQGAISQYRYDKIKTRYDVSFGESAFQIYPLLKGKHEILLVFLGDIQIAHIKRDTTTRDLLDKYTIYLSYDFSDFAVPITLFVLYYDHYEHGDHGESHKDASVQRTWGFSYGDANELYDPQWLAVHFPREPFEPLEIDVKKSRALGRILAIIQMIMEILNIVLVPFLMHVFGFGLVGLIAIALLAFIINVCERLYKQSEYYKG